MRYHINSFFSSISYRTSNILIDPGDEWEGFLGVDIVLLTHAHFDHIYGLNKVISLNPNAKVYTNLQGLRMLQDPKLNLSRYHETEFAIQTVDNVVVVDDCDSIIFNDNSISAFYTPGHNDSCITWVINDKVFTGDAYIPGVKVVTNLPGGNIGLANDSLDRIMNISIGKNIYPGHFV